MRKLQTELAMRPKANQIKMLIVGLAVNHDEIGLDMAVAMIGLFTKKRVINIGRKQGQVSGK